MPAVLLGDEADDAIAGFDVEDDERVRAGTRWTCTRRMVPRTIEGKST